jgi:hypothetical protein
MECQICLETFAEDKLYKVNCPSKVAHVICFECERSWRAKILPVKGVMTCPTCRQPEVGSVDSVYEPERQTFTDWHRLLMEWQPRVNSRPRPRRRPPQMCASGRDCRSIHGRTKTYLKCRECNVTCCNTCQVCIRCVPFGCL